MRFAMLSVLALVCLAKGAAATPFTLTLDSGQSTFTVRDDFSGDPVLGPVPLSGTITFDVTALPSGSFTVTQFDATGAGGIVLANGSGSGLHGSEALLFTTNLFLDVNVPGWTLGTTNLGIPGPLGTLTPTGDDSAIASAGFTAEFVWTESESFVFEIFAVPEPGVLALLGVAGAAATLARRRGGARR
jgi:hypothetical protein